MDFKVVYLKFGVYLTGPFGQSPQLYVARNAVKRERASQDVVDEQILIDTTTIVDKQVKDGFAYVIDPMFKFFYLFQPITQRVRGFSEGPQENYFDNNVFYVRPQINGAIDINAIGFTEDYIHVDLLPNERKIVVLPSPFTLMMLSTFNGVNGYEMPLASKKSAVVDLTQLIRKEAQHLAMRGFARIQYDEPAIVYKQYLGSQESETREDLELLRLAMQCCGKIDGATTMLHTYFGSAGSILPQLLDLEVDGLGIDGIETTLDDVMRHSFSEKELAIGLLDARSTAPENPQKIIQKLSRILDATSPKALWLTPNTGTEYRGWSNGFKKMRIMKEVNEALGK